MMQSQNKHYFYLDVVRGVSALCIVLYHYTTRYIENPITDNEAKVDWALTFPWGCAAVSTFFILSGFLTAKYLFSGDDNLNFKSAIQFIRNRIIRLYPAFVVAMFTTMLFLYFGFGVNIPLKRVLCNLTMLPALFSQPAIDGVYWTLQIELFFYMGIAVLMLLNNVKTIKIMLLLWVITPLLYCVDNSIIHTVSNIIFISDYISTFVAGISIYLITQTKENKFAYFLLLISFISQLFLFDIVHIVLFVVTIVVVYYIAKFNWSKGADNLLLRLLKWIGDISYPLYLIHQMLGFVIIYNIQILFKITSEWIVVIPIVFSVAYAYLVHKYIELPVQLIIKKYNKSR